MRTLLLTERARDIGLQIEMDHRLKRYRFRGMDDHWLGGAYDLQDDRWMSLDEAEEFLRGLKEELDLRSE